MGKEIFHLKRDDIFLKIYLLIKMCQCVICDCWWCNLCGACCAGWHWSFFVISCWVCKPLELVGFDPECCHCCTWTGYGGNFFCYGSLCCAPEAVKMYSRTLNGEMVGGGGNVVIINQQSPNNQGPFLTNNPY
jgi:hypothetical protein